MNLLKLTLSAILISASCFTSFSQELSYDKKEDIGNGLYKVMTNNRWGIIDKEGNLKLSAEYNEPVFVDGFAVISKYGTNQLVGIMDTAGNLMPSPQYFINPDYPVVSDGMLVVRESPEGKWGYLNLSTGFPLNVRIKGIKPGKDKSIKELGINGKNLEGAFVFDFAAPFIEGKAAAWAERIGWLHLDKDGNPRFTNPNDRPSLFRSSLNDGKAIIFDDRGTLLSMETPNNQAGVAMFLDDNVYPTGYSVNLNQPYTFSNNGFTLYLNEKFQADKLVKANGDSIIFIERKQPEIVEVADTMTVAPEVKASIDDIRVELSRKTVAATAKGFASVTFNITNEGSVEATGLDIKLDVQGSSKVWTGDLGPGATSQITITVPARFSSPSVTKKASWTIKLADSNNEVSGNSSITITRYKPNRR